MTASGGVPRDVLAADRLAKHINEHFSVNVTADEISAYINDNWGKIHVLAHAVHKSEPEPELVAKMKEALKAWQSADTDIYSSADDILKQKARARSLTNEALSWEAGISRGSNQ